MCNALVIDSSLLEMGRVGMGLLGIAGMVTARWMLGGGLGKVLSRTEVLDTYWRRSWYDCAM